MHKEEQIEVRITTKDGDNFLIVTYGGKVSFIKYVQFCFETKKQIVIYSLSTKRELIFRPDEIRHIRVRQYKYANIQ